MDLKVLEDQREIQDCLVFLEKMEIEDSLEKEVHQVKMDQSVQLGSQELSDPLVLLEKVVHLVKLVLLDPKESLEKQDVLVKQEKKDNLDLLELEEKQEFQEPLVCLDFQEKEGCQVYLVCQD
jgi:hypothetical protein